MKAYKVTNPDLTCNGYQFKLGKTFKHEGEIELSKSGFHACVKLNSCFNYYNFDSSNRVFEVEVGEWKGDLENRIVTSEIEFIRELTWHEVLELVNIGKDNTGRENTGNRNTGDWNTGDRNSGFLNTDTPKIRIFNKETDATIINFPGYFYFDLCQWISFNDMTDEEKAKHPKAKTTDGYLKVLDYKEAWKQSFAKASEREIEQTKALPNFDAQIFFEITGIDYFLNN